MIDLSTAFSFDSRGLLTFYSTVFHRNSQYEVQREVARERGLQTNKINSPRQNSNIFQMHIHCVLCQVLCSGDMRLLIEKRLFLHRSEPLCLHFNSLCAAHTERGFNRFNVAFSSARHHGNVAYLCFTDAFFFLYPARDQVTRTLFSH